MLNLLKLVKKKENKTEKEIMEDIIKRDYCYDDIVPDELVVELFEHVKDTASTRCDYMPYDDKIFFKYLGCDVSIEIKTREVNILNSVQEPIIKYVHKDHSVDGEDDFMWMKNTDIMWLYRELRKAASVIEHERHKQNTKKSRERMKREIRKRTNIN